MGMGLTKYHELAIYGCIMIQYTTTGSVQIWLILTKLDQPVL